MKPLITLISFVFLTSAVSAQNTQYQSAESIRISENDTLTGNTWLAGSLIEVSGFIDNDLFAAGEQIFLEGNIKDDAFLAGSNISFRGEVNDMLVTAGETVIIDGLVRGDLLSFGSNIHITNEGHIEGNAILMGSNVSFEGGIIDGWLRVGGNKIRLDGKVGKYTEIWSKDITFGTAYDAAYSTTINSEVPVYKENLGVIPDDLVISIEEKNIWQFLLVRLWVFASILLTGILLFWLFPDSAKDLHKFACESYWKNTGTGLLSFIFIPILILVLLGLILTIPLGILLGLTYLIILFLSYILVAMVIGVKVIEIFKKEGNNSNFYWGLFAGMILISILINLPYIGWLFNILLIFYGLGSIVHYIIRIRRSSAEKKAV
ncbi:hypothetical protein AB2B38_002715 [Balneola sp. MJW-20]|uniref:hypothetical protein n=1 Tax=Gracilimonas aurantiaca TaxID=3234185 RepID=UPI003465B4F8